jgi:hypothetical protein
MLPDSNRTQGVAILIAIAVGWLLIARQDSAPDEPHPASKGAAAAGRVANKP